MRVGIIIAEYNPFHNGHRLQIEKFKMDHGITHLVIIMSGNFVQRGAPAIIDKFSRADTAIENGANLVLELPAYFATQGAELFARGAMLVTKSMGVGDVLYFGSESGEISPIYEIASAIVHRRDEYESILRENISGDIPFARSREIAVGKLVGKNVSHIISSPNNILGIEYIKESIRLGMDLEFETIKRNTDYSSTSSDDSRFISATAARKMILEKEADLESILNRLSPYMPEESINSLIGAVRGGAIFLDEDSFTDELIHTVFLNQYDLEKYFEVSEGLGHSIYRVARESKSVSEMVDKISSKRISRARARRMLNNIILDVKKSDIEDVKKITSLPYIRVLAFDEGAREIFKRIKQNSEVSIVTSPAKEIRTNSYKNKEIYKKLFNFDLRTSIIYFRKYYSQNPSILSSGEPDFVRQVKIFSKKI